MYLYNFIPFFIKEIILLVPMGLEFPESIWKCLDYFCKMMAKGQQTEWIHWSKHSVGFYQNTQNYKVAARNEMEESQTQIIKQQFFFLQRIKLYIAYKIFKSFISFLCRLYEAILSTVCFLKAGSTSMKRILCNN